MLISTFLFNILGLHQMSFALFTACQLILCLKHSSTRLFKAPKPKSPLSS